MATYEGGPDNDFFLGTRFSDVFRGNDGLDTVSYTNSNVGITVRLSVEGPQDTGFGIDTFSSIESVYASSYDDRIYGTDGYNFLRGFAGADKLYGLGGFDWLDGGNGRDWLYGGAGDDYLEGGSGDDYLHGGIGRDSANYNNAPASVQVDLSLTGGQNTGWGIDTLVSLEKIGGSWFADRLYGNGFANSINGVGANDIISGRGGADVLNGNAGADRISGGSGNDEIAGQDGQDVLNGGTGKDYLTGGVDPDRFVFSAASHSAAGAQRDHITDFNEYADVIDLRPIDARTDLDGDQAFTWRGSGGFSGSAGEVYFIQTSLFVGDTIVFGDTDGDRHADFEIQLDRLHDLDEANFLL